MIMETNTAVNIISNGKKHNPFTLAMAYTASLLVVTSTSWELLQNGATGI